MKMLPYICKSLRITPKAKRETNSLKVLCYKNSLILSMNKNYSIDNKSNFNRKDT
jgi:hypothetical protein